MLLKEFLPQDPTDEDFVRGFRAIGAASDTAATAPRERRLGALRRELVVAHDRAQSMPRVATDGADREATGSEIARMAKAAAPWASVLDLAAALVKLIGESADHGSTADAADALKLVGSTVALDDLRIATDAPGGSTRTLPIAESGAHETACRRDALPMQRCRRLPADTAPVRSSGRGERDRVAAKTLTIQIVAYAQCRRPGADDR